MKLLPANLKRGGLEEKVFLGAVAKDTLGESFAYLKSVLIQKKRHSKHSEIPSDDRRVRGTSARLLCVTCKRE